jgi:DNA-binding CsgD family transcriptional regulator
MHAPVGEQGSKRNSEDDSGSTRNLSSICRFSQLLASVLPNLGGGQFCRFLVDAIGSLVTFDEASIIVYESGNMPQFEFAQPKPSMQSNLDIFLKGAFLLDPYYIAATKEQKRGFFRLRDLAPTGFRQSEYFQTYYQKSGLKDECGYLISIRDEGLVNIALGKTSSSAFRKNQLRLLADITPLIATLCDLHWQKKGRIDRREKGLRQQLEAALDCFGQSVLTQRECQVVNLILFGHSTKKMAEVMGISQETVKLHRKHAYSKLGIRSQSELFYLFINSLMSMDNDGAADPLIAYRQN